MSEIEGLNDRLEVKAKVEEFCRAILSGDDVALRSCVDPAYTSTHRDASGDYGALFRSVSVLRGVGRILTESASLRLAAHEASFGPLIFYPKISIEPSAAEVTVARVDGEWRISKLEDAPLPERYLYSLPDVVEVFDVDFTVRDGETNSPCASRVSIYDDKGEYWPPLGHMKYFPTGHNEDVGGDVLVGGVRYAYVEPDFVAPLPAGEYTARFQHGPEYLEAIVDFSVPLEAESVDVRMTRWTNMAERGWYSGDTHVHFLAPQAALLEARGEDLNVVNILATQWSDYYTNIEHFTGAPSKVSEPGHLVYVNEESRHPKHGHTSLLKIKKLVRPLAWGQRKHGYGEGVWHGHDHPTMAKVADETHAQGGFVTWAHMSDGVADGELTIDAALGKLDGVEIFHFVDPFFESTWDGRPRRPTTELWYRFLNCGFRLPAMAGTDKMFNRQIVGGVRVYVQVEGDLTYEKWIEAARSGRTFVSTGPILELTIDGCGIGESVSVDAGDSLSVSATAVSAEPLDALELVVGGSIVETVEDNQAGNRLTIDTKVVVDESTWIAARAHGPAPFRVQELPEFDTPGLAAAAHTSPVWVQVPDRPLRSPGDARILADLASGHLRWVEENARFLNEQHRSSMVETYAEALEILERMAAT